MTENAERAMDGYLRAVVRRSRESMMPAGFEPDWADKPRQWKYYPRLALLELPRGTDGPAQRDPSPSGQRDPARPAREDPPLPAVLDRLEAPDARTEPFDLAAVGRMLHGSYALVSRRLAVTANGDPRQLASIRSATWGRGTASGGGLYPGTVYWAAGAGGPVPPGVYHYDPARHGLQLLLAGDHTARIRKALRSEPDDAGAQADHFLLLGIKFWQNAFKYNNFSYHAVTMDVGSLLQTWRLSTAAEHRRVEPAFHFDQADLAELLGLDREREDLFALVPLDVGGAGRDGSDGPDRRDHPPRPAGRVTVRDAERSRRLVEFPLMAAVLAQARDEDGAEAGADPALGVAALPPEGGPRTPLPEPAEPRLGLRAAVSARCSSFGRFNGSAPITRAELAAILSAGHRTGVGPAALQYVFVNHVVDLARGAYVYDAETRELVSVEPGDHGAFLQWSYSLQNYNFEQAGAVVVPVYRVPALVASAGVAGYRLANAAAGAFAQTLYTVCSALGLGCGAVLGYDTVSYGELLHFDFADRIPLLAVLVGRERAGTANYRFELS